MNKSIFWYIVIFIGILILFSNLDVRLNILYGSILAIIFIIYLYENEKKEEYANNILVENKKNTLLPKPQKEHDEDMQNFLFSTQYFYQYNPQAYEDFIEELDSFIEIYEQTNNNSQQNDANYNLSGTNYNLLNDKKRSLLFTFNSILFNLPPNMTHETKLYNSVKTLDFLLGKYLNNIMKLFKHNIKQNGYSVSTELPKTGPMARNGDELYYLSSII